MSKLSLKKRYKRYMHLKALSNYLEETLVKFDFNASFNDNQVQAMYDLFNEESDSITSDLLCVDDYHKYFGNFRVQEGFASDICYDLMHVDMVKYKEFKRRVLELKELKEKSNE